MRRKLLFIILPLCSGLALLSCGRIFERQDVPRVRENFIQAYYTIDSLSFHSFRSTERSIKLTASGKWLSTEENEYYKSLYDDTHNHIPLAPGATAAYTNIFDRIEIVSDTDFNEIAAGTSLGEIVKFVAISPYKWLLSGCGASYDWSVIPEDFEKCKFEIPAGSVKKGLYPVDKLVSELTPDDLVLLMRKPGGFFCFVFEQIPENKEHNMTITFFEGDKSYTVKRQLSF